MWSEGASKRFASGFTTPISSDCHVSKSDFSLLHFVSCSTGWFSFPSVTLAFNVIIPADFGAYESVNVGVFLRRDFYSAIVS